MTTKQTEAERASVKAWDNDTPKNHLAAERAHHVAYSESIERGDKIAADHHSQMRLQHYDIGGAWGRNEERLARI